MTIITDTREQNLLEFPFEYVTEIKRQKLDVGDYAVEYNNGYIPPLNFERKSISDLYGTLGKGYTRFKKELARAKQSNIKLILIIECSFTKVSKGYAKSNMLGETVIKRLFTLWVKYDIPIIFCNDRIEMAKIIYETYCAIGRLMKKNKVNSIKLKQS